MIVIIGLVILIAAVLIGLVGVLANGGSTHALTDNFAVFGYHVTGSTGLLFLYGIVVGGIGLAGLIILLAGARRTALRGASARRELDAFRRDIPAEHSPNPEPQLPVTPASGTPTPNTTHSALDEPGNAAGPGPPGDRPAPHIAGQPSSLSAGPAPADLPRGGRRR